MPIGLSCQRSEVLVRSGSRLSRARRRTRPLQRRERIVNENDVVKLVRSYIEGLFPKACPRCGRRFSSLREYLHSTTHLGSPVLYDAPALEMRGTPLGPIAHANCSCGNTLTIGSEGMPPAQMVELLKWARSRAAERAIDMQQLLREIRDRIDAEVLRDGTPDRDP
jgi:hypothetical protein